MNNPTARPLPLIGWCLTLGLALLLTAGSAHAGGFDVTITNASPQIFSPPIVVTHRHGVSVFEIGDAPTDELAALAEDADSEGLIALLRTVDGVRDVAVGDGVILPGESMTVRVDRAGTVITVLGMMVTTNDTVYSARGRVRGTTVLYGHAYDAGSEANTLNCAHIPGPPCGNEGARVTAGAEGVITISQGINRGGLRRFDWRDPVVKVLVRYASD